MARAAWGASTGTNATCPKYSPTSFRNSSVASDRPSSARPVPAPPVASGPWAMGRPLERLRYTAEAPYPTATATEPVTTSAKATRRGSRRDGFGIAPPFAHCKRDRCPINTPITLMTPVASSVFGRVRLRAPPSPRAQQPPNKSHHEAERPRKEDAQQRALIGVRCKEKGTDETCKN